MAKIGLLEKTLNDDGMYEMKLNNHLLFRAADNEAIKNCMAVVADKGYKSLFDAV